MLHGFALCWVIAGIEGKRLVIKLSPKISVVGWGGKKWQQENEQQIDSEGWFDSFSKEYMIFWNEAQRGRTAALLPVWEMFFSACKILRAPWAQPVLWNMEDNCWTGFSFDSFDNGMCRELNPRRSVTRSLAGGSSQNFWFWAIYLTMTNCLTLPLLSEDRFAPTYQLK